MAESRQRSVVRVLGVDPGLSRCGLAVVEGPVRRPRAVRVEVARTSSRVSAASRLARLHAEIGALIEESAPHHVAVERVFFNANVATAVAVGQAAGVVLLAAAQADVPVVEYTPTHVKSTVAGDGGASKRYVAVMVQAALGLASELPSWDAADALALALCQLHHAEGAAVSSRARGGEARVAADDGVGQETVGAIGGGMSPRLRAALAQAEPGAQRSDAADVGENARGSSARQRRSGGRPPPQAPEQAPARTETEHRP
jgi:crossover junction endodeoxyribonuclease RuvC